MKKLLLLLTFYSTTLFAVGEPIKITIDSLANVSGNGSIEACGKAIHKDGLRPLLVTIKHDQSYYTTLTSSSDVWCVVYKRWTMNGKIEVIASELLNTKSDQSNLLIETIN